MLPSDGTFLNPAKMELESLEKVKQRFLGEDRVQLRAGPHPEQGGGFGVSALLSACCSPLRPRPCHPLGAPSQSPALTAPELVLPGAHRVYLCAGLCAAPCACVQRWWSRSGSVLSDTCLPSVLSAAVRGGHVAGLAKHSLSGW